MKHIKTFEEALKISKDYIDNKAQVPFYRVTFINKDYDFTYDALFFLSDEIFQILTEWKANKKEGYSLDYFARDSEDWHKVCEFLGISDYTELIIDDIDFDNVHYPLWFTLGEYDSSENTIIYHNCFIELSYEDYAQLLAYRISGATGTNVTFNHLPLIDFNLFNRIREKLESSIDSMMVEVISPYFVVMNEIEEDNEIIYYELCNED